MDLHNIQLDGTLESQALLPSPAALARAAHAEGHSTGWMLVTLAWTLLYGVGLFATLDRRFDRPFDLNSGIWTIAGRNLNHDGFANLRGGCYVSAGDFPREQREFYASHPPLLTWMMAGWMRLFGESNYAARAMPVVFSLLNVLLVYALARRTLNPVAGFCAAALYSLMPMTAYFSQVINMEPFGMTAMLGASLAYLHLSRGGKGLGWTMLLLCIALGCWMDWPMFIFAGILAAAHFFSRPSWRALGSSALIILVPLLVFEGFVAHVRLNDGNFYENAVKRAKIRMRLGEVSGNDRYVLTGHTSPATQSTTDKPLDTRPGYQILLGKLRHPHEFRRWIVGLITPTAAALGLMALVAWTWWSRDLPGDRTARSVLLRLVIVGIVTQVIYTGVFAEGSTRHEYWQYFLALPVALLAGGLCAWGLRRVMLDGMNLPALAGLCVLLIAAATPAVAWGPFSFRLGAWHDQPNPAEDHGDFHFDYIEPMRAYTDPRDLCIMRAPNLGTALEWYANRMVLGDKPIYTIAELDQRVAMYPQARTLYLWNPTAPAKIAEPIKPLIAALKEKYPLYRAGPLHFFLLRGRPDPKWQKESATDGAPMNTD